MEYTALESLIPYKDDQTMKNEIDKKRGEPYKSALEEHNELIQQLVLKNKHIKEIIDQMRNIIWEINTMLAMRWNYYYVLFRIKSFIIFMKWSGYAVWNTYVYYQGPLMKFQKNEMSK